MKKTFLKRTLGTILCAALVIGSLTGCGKEKSGTKVNYDEK